MLSDDRYDHMSMNFGMYTSQNRKFVKQPNANSRKHLNVNYHESGNDTNSVFSVITGTKQANYFGGSKTGEFKQKTTS